MDCTSAERLIQMELDALVLGDDDRFGTSARLSGAEAQALAEHCAGCPKCRGLRAELRSIDAALAATAMEKAPAWLPTAVMREIARPTAAPRLEPVVVTVGSVLGTVAAVTTLVRTGALSGVAGPIGRFSSCLDSWLDGIVSATTTVPGVEAVQSSVPVGVAAGVVWTVVAVGTAFLAVSAYRLSKELSLDARRAFSR